MLIAKMGIAKAFDATGIRLAPTAAQHHEGGPAAHRLILKHRSGNIRQRIPGAHDKLLHNKQHNGLDQGAISRPILFMNTEY